MSHTSEYEVEDIFIDRLEGIGYKFIKLDNYDDVLANFREQLAKFNAKKLAEKGHDASFSDAEFNRIMIHVDNHSVYESAKILRDKYVLQLDNGESVYIDFFSGDTDRNIYQVTHQVTMDKAHKDDEPYFLDKAIHSENIYNVMLEHIHNCKFLVADLTTQNLGVYYEAGYAKALGKTVIFTCKDSDFANIHFDIKQVQTISWHDEPDLSEKLAEQICGLNLGKR